MRKKEFAFSERKRGFTLIELLVVIAIIAILSVVVFVALDPAKRFSDARNSRRWSDVNNLLTAVHECIVDAKGATASCIGTLTAGNTYEIVSSGATGCNAVCTGATSASSCADLDTNLAKFLKELPKDPAGVATGHTGYSISVDANNIVTINACAAESSEVISISR